MYFNVNESEILSLPSTQTAGNSYTGSLLFLDEWDNQPWAESTYINASPAIDRGNSQLVCAFTPNLDKGPDTFPKVEFRRANNGELGIKTVFLSYFERPGNTIDTYNEAVKQYTVEKVRSQYPRTVDEALSPIIQKCYFDQNILNDLLKAVSPAKEIIGGVSYIYRDYEPVTKYFAGLDGAEGKGGDSSVLTIVGQRGLGRELVAIIHANLMPADVYAETAIEILRRYHSPCVCGQDDAFTRIIMQRMIDMGYDKTKFYYEDKEKKKLGYPKNTRKAEAVTKLDQAVRGGMVINYKPAISEMFSFQSQKLEAAEGAHDDIVMSLAMAMIAEGVTKPQTRVSTTNYMRLR
jgi:hypothetical protein